MIKKIEKEKIFSYCQKLLFQLSVILHQNSVSKIFQMKIIIARKDIFIWRLTTQVLDMNYLSLSRSYKCNNKQSIVHDEVINLILLTKSVAKCYFSDTKTIITFSFQEKKSVPRSGTIYPSYFSWIKHTWKINKCNDRIIYITSLSTDMGMNSILIQIISSEGSTYREIKWNMQIFHTIFSRKDTFLQLFFDLSRETTIVCLILMTHTTTLKISLLIHLFAIDCHFFI
jgi:hypothetical protein